MRIDAESFAKEPLRWPLTKVGARRGASALLKVPALAQLDRRHDAVVLARDDLARPDEPRERVHRDDRVHLVDPTPLRFDHALELCADPGRDEAEERREDHRALLWRGSAALRDAVGERDEAIEPPGW